MQEVAARVLQDDAHVAQPHVGGGPAGQVAEPPPAHLDQAGGGPQQAGEQPQQGGFPGSRRAEQRDGVALGHREIHAAQRRDLLPRFPVDLDQAFAAHHHRAVAVTLPGSVSRPMACALARTRGEAAARGVPRRRGHVGVSRSWSRLTPRISSTLAVTAATASSATATPRSTISGAAAGT